MKNVQTVSEVGGGVFLEIRGSVPPVSPNPDPISDQKIVIFPPVFTPGL